MKNYLQFHLNYFEVQEKIEGSTNGQLASPEEEFEWKETREELYSNINRLPDALRLPVFLHYIHELEYREIARILDLPLNTVKSNGRRGWLQLQKIIKEGKK
jgi:RNA polymerase sigma factor (sigma-70 family)